MQDDHSLGAVPLFAGLNAEQQAWLRAVTQTLSYRAGEDIFQQGGPADGLLILLEGQAVLFSTDQDGRQTAIAQVNPGQRINQEALFSETLQSASLRAAQATVILRLSRESFQQLLSQRPELLRALGLADPPREGPLINPLFAEQRDDEEIIIQTHRHWWSFVRTAWLPLLLMPAMWVGAFMVEAQTVTLALLALSILLPGFALVYFYLEWRNDSVIVTDQRVIRINRTILTMYRQVTQVGLESVHEINFDIPAYDLFARLFRYGTVIVKTAGAQGNLRLDFMPKPQQFQKFIIEDRRYFEQRKSQRHHKLVRGEMQRWMAGEQPADDAQISIEPDQAPRPLRGTNGYLSSRIEMSNGDIVYRKHASVWAQHTGVPLAIVIVAAIALALTFTVIGADLRIFTFSVSMLALLIGCLAYYWMDWDWRNDLYIISDDTITLVRKRPFFLQNLRDQILVERIDNVESVTSGLFAALMRYGDVRMSLVGADEPKLFRRVARPQDVQQEISRRQHNKTRRRARYDAQQQRQIIGEVLGAAAGTAAGQAAPGISRAGVNSASPRADQSPQASIAAGAIRKTHNADRNRPPRTPRKRQAAPPSRSETASKIGESQRRRPGRFRRVEDGDLAK